MLDQRPVVRKILQAGRRLLEARAPQEAERGVPRMPSVATVFHVAMVAAHDDQRVSQVRALGQTRQEAVNASEMTHGLRIGSFVSLIVGQPVFEKKKRMGARQPAQEAARLFRGVDGNGACARQAAPILSRDGPRQSLAPAVGIRGVEGQAGVLQRVRKYARKPFAAPQAGEVGRRVGIGGPAGNAGLLQARKQRALIQQGANARIRFGAVVFLQRLRGIAAADDRGLSGRALGPARDPQARIHRQRGALFR